MKSYVWIEAIEYQVESTEDLTQYSIDELCAICGNRSYCQLKTVIASVASHDGYVDLPLETEVAKSAIEKFLNRFNKTYGRAFCEKCWNRRQRQFRASWIIR